MNREQINKHTENKIPRGYQMIFDDTEEKFIYFALGSGVEKEIPRKELLEIIESGKSIPLLEIKKRN
ncbi:MAG: hypothetical protein M3033_05220 [Acidobacteriota bacterium]|nr:hypothetical protein [Acidobacteriota bacterium]